MMDADVMVVAMPVNMERVFQMVDPSKREVFFFSPSLPRYLSLLHSLREPVAILY